MDKERATKFAVKAEKLLGWCDQSIEEMRAYGRVGAVGDVERVFVCLLQFFDSIHQALADCAKKLNQNPWRVQLNQFRESDPLLRYLWKARNSEIHDALVKWRPSMKHIEFRILDSIKATKIADPAAIGDRAAISKLVCFVYEVATEQDLIEKFKINPHPSTKAQEAAGVQLLYLLDSLSLDSFTIGRGLDTETIQAPSMHDGALLPPSADQSVYFAVRFYRNKLGELRTQLAR
ncbi:MAG: hypothetical protein HQK55_00425 [Deltaproteobacteria bacterium]|nr:hypothetical protein [Deltaproteobacteria bacterium]